MSVHCSLSPLPHETGQMRRSSAVSTSRALDAVYDPLYAAGSAGPANAQPPATQPPPSLYRPTAPSALSSTATAALTADARTATAASAATADFTARRADGSLISIDLHAGPQSAGPPAASAVSLRSAVQGASRLKYLKRPLRAFIAPTAGQSAGQQSAVGATSHSLTSASPFAGRLMGSPADNSTASATAAATQLSSVTATGGDDSGEVSAAAAHASNSVSVGSQSLYRESGSQTVPYSPDVLLDPQPSPQVLELLGLQSSLTYANGSLPAMLDAVEAVEAAREKAAWEASLPPLSSVGGHDKRKRMVEQREWTEWKAKEAAIRAEQERAMLLILQQQDDRDSRQQQRLADAVQAKGRELEERATEADQRRREEKRRAVRLLGKQRLRDEKRTAFLTGGLLEVDAHSGQFGTSEEKTAGSSWTAVGSSMRSQRGASQSAGGTSSSASALLELSRADAVFGAVDFSSEVYAPLQRNGAAVAYAHKRTVVDFDIPALSDYQTLTALQSKALSRPHRDAAAEAAEAGAGGGGVRGGERLRLPRLGRPLNRRESTERWHLMHVDAQIAEQKEQTSLERESGDEAATAVAAGRWQRTNHASAASSSSTHHASVWSSAAVNVYKHFCPVQRAPTPSLPPSQPSKDGHRVAVTLLQRLLRGRAQQSTLLARAQHRQHLIREMVQVAQQVKQQHRADSNDSRVLALAAPRQQQQQQDGADEASTDITAFGEPTTDNAAVDTMEGVPLSPSLMLDILAGSLLSDGVVLSARLPPAVGHADRSVVLRAAVAVRAPGPRS